LAPFPQLARAVSSRGALNAPYTVLRWVRTKDGGSVEDFDIPSGVTTAQDNQDRWVVFFSDQWAINYFERRNPNAELSEIPWDEVEKAKVA
jgi:peptide subunit release factor RF-3